MSIALSQTNGSSLIHLEGALDIGAAAELKVVLLDALKGGKRILVALDEVADMDITGFQLLWAAKREAEQTGVAFALEGQPAENARGLLADAGLDVLEVFS